MHNKKLMIIFAVISLLFFSCSDKNSGSIENNRNKEIIDSLSLEKNKKSLEAKALKAELDSLKKLRDSLNIVSSKKTKNN